jgi:DNA-binding SARP family transcriptional activator
VSLYRLRQALDDPTHSFLDIKRDSVQFNARSGHWLDVAAFSALIAECSAHNHTEESTCEECGARLARAAALYRGDFLAGLALSNNAAFEEWVLIQREGLRLQALGALTALAAYHEQRGDYAALCRAARRQLELEPWQEAAQRCCASASWCRECRSVCLYHLPFGLQCRWSVLGSLA